VVQNTDGFSPFSPEVLRNVDRVEGVSSVSGVRFSEAKVRGVSGNQSVSSIDPRTFPDLYKLDMKEGGEAAVRNLGPGDVLVKKGYADSHDTKLGDTLQVTTPNGKRIAPKVIGIVDDKGGLLANLTVTNAVAQTQFGEPKDAFGLVGADPGADLPAVKQQISKLLDARYPEAEVLTNQEFKDDIAGQVNQLLGLIYALLALAIIVSLFGIVNTLVLSISERTRELGMLRAHRDVAQAGQAHHPLGGGHHRAHRRRARRVHGRGPRGALHPAARRLHAVDPGAVAHHRAHPRRAWPASAPRCCRRAGRPSSTSSRRSPTSDEAWRARHGRARRQLRRD
jgi:hypothetical protein